jgi:Transposase DDE domain
LGVPGVPDATTLYRLLRRLDGVVFEEALGAVSRCWLPAAAKRRATVAVEATGLTPGASSTCFVRRVKDREPGCTWRHRVQWIMAIEVDRRLMVAQTARRGPTNDCATLRPLVEAAHRRVPMGRVLADAEFDSERNHRHIRTALQANSSMPATRGRAKWRIQGVRAQLRQAFPRDEGGPRSLMESVLSAAKRKLSARAPGRALYTQCLQALRLGVASDIYRL